MRQFLLLPDVTRTFPVGRNSHRSSGMSTVSPDVAKEAIAMIRPGVRFDDVHMRATEILVDGLRGFGLLSGETKRSLKKGNIESFICTAPATGWVWMCTM
jgi:Xaa-Pro aminopeptidase